MRVGARDYIQKNALSIDGLERSLRLVLEYGRAQNLLSRERLFLSTILDNIGALVVAVNSEGRINRFNRACERVTGHSAIETMGRHIWDIFPDFKGVVLDGSDASRVDMASVCLSRNGERYAINWSQSIVTSRHGSSPEFIVFTGMEVTELNRKREEVEALNVTLERRVEEEVAKNRDKDLLMLQQSRLAAMGEMIGNIAHQWRQPINAVSLILANIQSAFEFEELTADLLEEKVTAGQQIVVKMSATIDDFRNFFKPDKKKTVFNLETVIDEALSLVEASLKSSHITVTVTSCKEPVSTFGFANEYSQVILLILTNARDAIIEHSRGSGEIYIHLFLEAGRAMATIRDNGGGIAPDIIDRIFDPYFTTKAGKQGTGIGLYMAKVIIEEHMEGQIEAKNVDKGAEFQVTIPIFSKTDLLNVSGKQKNTETVTEPLSY